jgi:hypothetical protein
MVSEDPFGWKQLLIILLGLTAFAAACLVNLHNRLNKKESRRARRFLAFVKKGQDYQPLPRDHADRVNEPREFRKIRSPKSWLLAVLFAIPIVAYVLIRLKTMHRG